MPARIHRIGEPENASEQKAIRTLGEVLPEGYFLVHNFELTTGRGLPYEYDLVVIGPFAVWHVEVKGYRGEIKGDAHTWQFENGGVMPSPIPLANKKTKILASKLAAHDRRLNDVWVETAVLLTDDKAKVRLKDDQAFRVVQLKDALEHFTNPKKLPVQVNPIVHLQDAICEALFGCRPNKPVKQIGLYDVVEKLNQTETRTVFLGKHRYIRTRPMTVLKVFHFDIYTSEEEKQRQIEAIFHDQDAMRVIGQHPNIIDTGDFFAWDDNKFVLPTEWVEDGRPLQMIFDEDEDKQIAWKVKADIVAKMCRGLRHAHKRGVIHRDVRPLNVVIGPGEPPGKVVKLVNFDLAFLEGAPDLSDMKGLADRLDPRYVAPEVWRDPAAATRRSDIYSLGIVFYQLITSEVPYAHVDEALKVGRTPLDRELLLKELSTPGSEDFMDSPGDAADVIARMCAQDPAQRHTSLDEVLEDLSILAEVDLPPPASTQRFGR